MTGWPQMNRDEAKDVLDAIGNFDWVETQYWMNQFISDDMTQFECDSALHKFMCKHIVPKYRVSDGKTSEQTVDSVWKNCVELVSNNKNKFRRTPSPKSKSENAEIRSVAPVPKRVETVHCQNSMQTHVAPASPDISAAIKELAGAIGGSLGSVPRKVTISLTYEL